MNSSICPTDGTLIGTTTPSQSEPGSNGNEGYSRTGASPSDSLVLYLEHASVQTIA